jgi:hypothetical protein
VLDHVFTDAIGALRDAFEAAMLERQAFEERFSMDMLLGDMTWETSYGLPGEGTPPRVQVDVTLTWPTWAQAAYRSWYIGEELAENPRIDIELVLRVQRLSTSPDPELLMAAAPATSPTIGRDRLDRTSSTVEAVHDAAGVDPEYAIEIGYEGSYELVEEILADGARLDDEVSALGGWIASVLVKVGDLPWDFLPPLEDD